MNDTPDPDKVAAYWRPEEMTAHRAGRNFVISTDMATAAHAHGYVRPSPEPSQLVDTSDGALTVQVENANEPAPAPRRTRKQE